MLNSVVLNCRIHLAFVVGLLCFVLWRLFIVVLFVVVVLV